MSSINQHIRNIISANNNNRLAIFVGAGISKSSETESIKLPLWSDLIDEFKKALNINHEYDFFKIAQLYYLEFKEYSYYEKLKEYFPEEMSPSKLHKLIFELKPQVIITTNWDNILEKAIEENAYIYETICCDKDLVKSTLQKKLIKMHGDFKNHNIVFKEDDYLNYSYNFPLIENYIKSILSTHTVVFLGYSYNDINLKHIMKWLQNHSKAQPPLYFVAFGGSNIQSKYLENHGMNIISLDEPYKSPKETEEFSANNEAFLLSLKDGDSSVSLESDDDIVSFICNRLYTLKNLNSILLEQIQKTLTNCGFIHYDGKVILEFYNNTASYDFDSKIRDIYRRFVKILKKLDCGDYSNDKILDFFEILSKANLDGIVTSEDDAPRANKEYIAINKYLRKSINHPEDLYLDFSYNNLNTVPQKKILYLHELAFKKYQLRNFEKAYSLEENAISLSLKQKNYIWMFILMFNRNALLSHLKWNQYHDKYKHIQEYDLKEKFDELPRDLQKSLEPIFDIVNFDYFYKRAFDVSKKLQEKENSKRIIESGGFVFSTNITAPYSEQKNLILFVLRNMIMIENYTEYKTINKYFIEIAIIRQTQKQNITLSKIELFSAIKYLTDKELRSLLKEYYIDDSNRNGKFLILDQERKWLVNTVLINIVELCINDNDIFRNHENLLKNICFILSLTKLSKGEVNKILNQLLKVINEGKNGVDIFEIINQFLAIQFNLYKAEVYKTVLLKIIETIISKLSDAYVHNAIITGKFSTIYIYAEKSKAVFKNEQLLDRLLLELKKQNTSDQINMSISLLSRIYYISNEKLKKKIKKYILKIHYIPKKVKPEELFRFEFNLIIMEFKSINKELINKFDNFLEKYKQSKSFSSSMYALRGQVDYLFKEKKYKEFESVSKKINSIIDDFKSSPIQSFF